MNLALFPLNAVLFPGGVLGLRVFEARYVDLVRDCLREDVPFGVVRITVGSEVGEPAQHERIGCAARIEDCDSEQPGVLRIRTLGLERFEVNYREVKPNGAIVAEVEPIDADAAVSVPAQFAQLAELTRRITREIEATEPISERRAIRAPYRFESCAWVSNRLCEVLPISAEAKQKLMELNDPLARITLVHQYLQQKKVI